MPRLTPLLLLALLSAASMPACAAASAQDSAASSAKQESDDSMLKSSTLSALKMRSIGPALTGGRVTDFAVDPEHRQNFYVALASGGVWKTSNAGTTFQPIFDGQASYSIGCLALDPSNPHVLWVGSGENNSQRSVSFGDGVYRTRDGGKHWENLGLKDSEHIGKILIDPRDSNTVFVAAQGPLWRAGGDRGLYKTTDGGATWRKVLEIDEHTGVNEVHMDPRNPDLMYASSYQRRRHVWTLINGGPGSAIWKSEDGGENWRKLKHGLPKVDLGRIGMTIAPANPDVVYAVIEAAMGENGLYRSSNRGETWTKQSSYISSSPQYYNELVCDPNEVNTLYSLDTFLQRSTDGGKTFKTVDNKDRHVDHHALWIDPNDPSYHLLGCDGGVYHSNDGGTTWAFHNNMPIGQYYRVSLDNRKPFYYVYGGTQDNNSLGGPSQTTSNAGIANEDWFVTVGGDGYETVADPTNPDILYSLWQYGGLVRHDHKSGEIVDIKPREKAGEAAYRWNWDSPLMVSPHSPTRLYFAANILFRSDDRGDTWEAVSGDLSRNLNRNELEVMDKIWGVDTVSKNRSTSFYGNIVALNESTLIEGLLYVGTDDGLIQVSEDGGQTWRKQDSFPGVPERSYVTDLEPSLFDADTVYASFHNHKMGDFKPYVLKSTDRGRSWTPMAGDLGEREFVWALAQDHVNPELLFAGTEFGLYCTLDEGDTWIQLKGGLPTIAVRDLAIDQASNDLVLATFGRSFYVLDDYSPLRGLTEASMTAGAQIYPVADALLYMKNSRLGGRRGRGSQGASFYTAPNPAFGATITYSLSEKLKTRKELRQDHEKKLGKDGGDVPYPSWEELRAEDEESTPQVLMVIKDDQGQVVRRLNASRNKGMHRLTWDLREPARSPLRLKQGKNLLPWESADRGLMVLPGTYSATLAQVVDGKFTEMGQPQSFEVVPLGLATLATADAAGAYAFQKKVAHLRRAVRGASRVLGETEQRLKFLRKAVIETPGADAALLAEVDAMVLSLGKMRTLMHGDKTISAHNEPTPPAIQSRVENIVGNQWNTTNAPTTTERDAYQIASEAFAPLLAELRQLVLVRISGLEAKLEQAGAAWTPGRLPDWEME
jgi:photosystem II stability/assembly factor-like uncharacterized protein